MNTNELRNKVIKILEHNNNEGYSKLLKKNYCYISPDKKKYPFQWFWDTFFHIYILCACEKYELAKRNLKSLFAVQEPDGFVGHMIYWKRVLPPSIWQIIEARPTLKRIRPHMSSLIQPTLAAQALEQIYLETKDHKFLTAMLPKISKYHEWLISNRCFESNGLIFIISPFESGIDEKPSYDSLIGSHPYKGTFKQYLQLMLIDGRNFVMRYNLKRIYNADKFIVKDTALNTIYALDLSALSRLFNEVDDKVNSAKFDKLAQKVSDSIMKLMYNKEDLAFYDLAGHDNRQLKSLTFSIFFPIVLPSVPVELSKEIIEKHLLNKNEFNLNYPVPSVSKSEDVFNPNEAKSIFFDFLWRGPTWVFINWFLYNCLKKKGFDEMAEKLVNQTYELIDKSGFREYYNPNTGEGYGAENFTWSGLILNMIKSKNNL